VNDFVQTWWPVLVTFLSFAALAMAFWVNSQIDKKCAALSVGGKASKDEVAAVEKSTQSKADALDDKFSARCAAIERAADLQLNAAIGKLYGVVNDFGNRIARIETKLDALPAAEAVHEIALQCRDLIGEMKKMAAEVKGMRETTTAELEAVRETGKHNQQTLQRVENYILKNEQALRR
jgi:hypothetical protein